MDTKLSLELINTCLLMEQKNRACNDMLYDPDTESFLENEKNSKKNNIDTLLQQLEQEKQSVAEFLLSITSEDAVKTRLAEAVARVALRQQEYDIAEKNYNEAAQLYEAQRNYVSSIEVQLDGTRKLLSTAGSATTAPQGTDAIIIAGHWNPIITFEGDCKWRVSPHQHADQACRTRKESLKQKVQEQEKSLNQAKNDLHNKGLDKTSTEQIKTQANTQLQDEITLKNQANKELETIKENQDKIQASQNELNAASQEFANVEQVLDELSIQINKEQDTGPVCENDIITNEPSIEWA